MDRCAGALAGPLLERTNWRHRRQYQRKQRRTSRLFQPIEQHRSKHAKQPGGLHQRADEPWLYKQSDRIAKLLRQYGGFGGING